MTVTLLEISLERAKLHGPNTPRERDASGRKVHEPVQCAKCLQYWPCDIHLLAAEVKRMRDEVEPYDENEEEEDGEADDDPSDGRGGEANRSEFD